MSNKLSQLERIKQKVKQSGESGVHAQIIDTSIIEDDRREIANAVPDMYIRQVDVNVNDDVHVDVNVDEVTQPPAISDIEDPPRERRIKFEDNHARQTVWVRREIVEMIDKETAGERGEKTRIVNEALEQYFRKRKR